MNSEAKRTRVADHDVKAARGRRKPWAWLAQGDCLEVLKTVPEKSVDLVLCDLPYGVTDCEWDHKIPLEPLWQHYGRVLHERGAIALFAQQPFASELAASAPKRLLRYEWIWDKGCATGFANARRMPLRRHENILVFYRKAPLYQPQGLRPCHRTCRTRTSSEVYDRIASQPYVRLFTGYPQSILQFKREPGAAPCQKPIALLEFLIRAYTRQNSIVLDNAMGTGSCGVAAMNAQRSFIGIELDPDRFQTAERRIVEIMRRHGACRARSFYAQRAEA